MKRVFNFGKIDYYGNGRKVNTVEVTIELEKKEQGYVFSAMGMVWNAKHTDCVCGGQCLDELLEFNELSNNETFKTIHALWKKYHLNDMHAGTKEQEFAIKSWKLKGNTYNYKAACEYLDSIGLLTVEKDGKPYTYGFGWIFEPIPDGVIDLIKDLINED